MSRDNFEIVMEEIIVALKEAGYDPYKQIYDYIQTGMCNISLGAIMPEIRLHS